MAARARAGLPDGYSGHDLRHFYATTMLAQGYTVHEVASYLGDTPQMVLKVYGHVTPDRGDVRAAMLRARDAEWRAAMGDGDRAGGALGSEDR